MSDSGRPRANRERWASDHERACQRGAERLSLPLPAAENAWLDRHLRVCSACASVVAEYAAEQRALHALQEPLPPRDLWARTAAALDRAERQAGRDIPSPSVFPGRTGRPGARGSRSIRGMRAEQRASAFRSAPRPIPARLLLDRPRRASRPAGLRWVAPFGALAALAIVIVVGGNSLLSSSIVSPIGSPLSASSTLAAAVNSTPFATPIQVGAGEVAWLTPGSDGTYSLNFADVDQVCPANAKPDCAPIAGSSPRNLPTIGSTLHTVIRSTDHRQLVYVPTSTKKRGGGSVIVVAVPTQVPASTEKPSQPPVTASVVPSTAPAPTPAASSAAATGSPEPSAPAATGSPTPPVTAAPATPTSSADATPTDSSSVGTSVPSSIATLTTFAPGGSAVPPTSGSNEPSAVASPSSSTSASASPSEPSAAGSEPVASATPAVTPAGPVGPSESGSPSSSSSSSATASPLESVTPSGPEPTAAALAIISDVVVVGETASYSPDGTMLAFSARPADGSQGPDIYLWRPGDAAAHALTTDHASVFSGWLNNELLGSRAVNDAGSPASSQSPAGDSSGSGASDPNGAGASSVSPAPSDASSFAPSATSTAEPGSSAAAASDSANSERAITVQFVADAPRGALAQSFVLDPATAIESPLTSSAWRPVVDPTGRFVAYWAGTLRYDSADYAWVPDRGALVLASWPALRATDPNTTLAPTPLLENGAASIPAGEWDIRWDETGSHIAVWAADAGNPELGRLTLLTIDAAGRVDPRGVSLHDAPALAGFSIGTGRLAWATPPGQDGEGSRLQVLAWSGENAGNIDSQPASGGDAVIVVR